MATNWLHPFFEHASDVDGLGLYNEEDRRVLRWRLEQFIQLGFKLAAATVLAAETVDLALARKLVARGCPLETAARILL